MQKLLVPFSIIVAGLIIAASNLYINGKLSFGGASKNEVAGVFTNRLTPSPTSAPQPTNPAPAGPVNIPIGNAPVLGKAEAPVTVVEFSDYQCPYCAAVFGIQNGVYSQLTSAYPGWQPIIPNLQKDYIDKGLVKFVYLDFAFLDQVQGATGNESRNAANAAHCAGDQGQYWPYHDLLFKNQSGENQGTFKDTTLKTWGATLGLETTKFNKCLDDKTHLQEVIDSTNAGRGYGVQGTPAFFVDGRLIPGGAVPYSDVRSAVDQELKK